MDEGLIGMTEDADVNTVDMVTPFLCALIDTFCGEFDSVPATNLFTNYVDLADILFK